jgi:hypothetical protein
MQKSAMCVKYIIPKKFPEIPCPISPPENAMLKLG